MIPARSLYVARDARSGMHSFVRDAENSGTSRPSCSPSIDLVNELLMAKNVESLADAAERLGPMFLGGDDLDSRTLDWRALRALPSSPDDLLAECFFDPYARRTGNDPWAFERSGNVARLAASRVVESRDFCSTYSGALGSGGGASLVVEPLQDWILLRNLLSITLRLGALLREGNGDSGTLLEGAGFSRVGRRSFHSKLSIDSPGYAIPVMFNPFFREGKVVANCPSSDGRAAWPLYERIAKSETRHAVGGLDIEVGSLRGSDSIKFVSVVRAVDSTGEAPSRWLRSGEARWTYLVIVGEEGKGQKALADSFLNAVDSQLYRPTLSFSGRMMAEVSVCAPDLPTALWGIVRNHPNHYLLTCENCHRTVFSTTQGPNRRFCSDSCRVTWSKRH